MCKGTKKILYSQAYGIFFVFLQREMEQVIQHTVEVLRRGGIILYPTDTIWGIGCDARNRDAVERLYAIKERDHPKSMLVLVAHGEPGMDCAWRPTTFIMPHAVWCERMHLCVADNLPAADGSLGIRVPNHFFCQEVLRRLKAPIVSTSANLSGYPSPSTYNDIEKELKSRVDYCVPPLPGFLSDVTQGSRIIKINADGSETVIRP